MTLNEFIKALEMARKTHGGEIEVVIEPEYALCQDYNIIYTGYHATDDEIVLFIAHDEKEVHAND